MDKQTRNSTLNIFALPNQTTILFLIIVSVILAIFITASVGGSLFPTWPLALALLILPWRSFFATPGKVLNSKHRLYQDQAFTLLKKELEVLSQKIALRRIPKLVLWNERDVIQADGSFRHWFIIIGLKEALGLEQRLDDPKEKDNARAILLHELYHLKTGDTWQLNYTNHFVRGSRDGFT